MNQPSRIERRPRSPLIVEIAEHQAGAAAADLADLAGRQPRRRRSSAAKDADLVARAGAAGGLDDQAAVVGRQRVLVRAGLGHAVAALRHDAVREQSRRRPRRRGGAGDAEAFEAAEALTAAFAQLAATGRWRGPARRAGSSCRSRRTRSTRLAPRGQVVHDELARRRPAPSPWRRSPRLWLSGLRANRPPSRSPIAQSARNRRALASSVLSLCITPFGRPVVPDVKAR